MRKPRFDRNVQTRVLELLKQRWYTPLELHVALDAQYAFSTVSTTINKLKAACHPIERKFVKFNASTRMPVYAYRLKPVDTATGS